MSCGRAVIRLEALPASTLPSIWYRYTLVQLNREVVSNTPFFQWHRKGLVCKRAIQWCFFKKRERAIGVGMRDKDIQWYTLEGKRNKRTD